ncbi:MAG TPA: ABC transporter permease [Patescibacteria group bacterium]|nr:ABC transporter permease [Patescibacteria group bacterium]
MRGPSAEFRIIFSEEFRRQVLRPGFAFFALLIPFLMLIAIPLTPFVVDLIEEDNPEQTQDFEAGWDALATVGYVDSAGVLLGPGSLDSPKMYGDRAAGIEAVQQGEIDTLFILPVHYFESGQVEKYRAASENEGFVGTIWGSPAQWNFSGFLSYALVADQVEPDLLARALNSAEYRNYAIGDDGAVSDVVPPVQAVGEIMVPLLFGVLLVMAVLTGSSTLMSSVAEEKETRMIEMLVTSAAPLSIMSAKLLALGLAALIQIAVWVSVAVFALPAIIDRIPNGGELTISPDLLVVVLTAFVLGFFLFSALALFMATLVPSTSDAQRQTGLLSMLLMLPIMFIGLFINNVGGTLSQIFTYFPFTAPTMIMLRLGLGSISGSEIAAALGLVAITAVLLLWVASRVFRAGILLSGQRITPDNVWAALSNSDS